MKSEKLRKLEQELEDLQRWLDLSLVPKSDLEKHKAEIKLVAKKIKEEKQRLKHLKESGEFEEYETPKKVAGRQAYSEPTIPGVESGSEGLTDAGLDMDNDVYETEPGTEEGTGEITLSGEEEDPFSDKNRWKRGILEDPDSDGW